MKAQTTNNGTGDQRFQLDLSFIEMHIIMKAMGAYESKMGYGGWNETPASDGHINAAEKLHTELTDAYCQEA